MSTAIDQLSAAMQRAEAIRPNVGGFPYLAESLRQAGVTRNIWSLPACQSLFLTEQGPVMARTICRLLVDLSQLPAGAYTRTAFDRRELWGKRSTL